MSKRPLGDTDVTSKSNKKQPKTHDVNGTLLNKCKFINPKRMKQCGLQCKKDQIYCYAHLNVLNTQPVTEKEIKLKEKILELNKLIPIDQLDAENKNENDDKRVVCPLDPSHTVWESKLKSHLKKCNILKKQADLEKSQNDSKWYALNYNLKDVESNNDPTDVDINNDIWLELMAGWVGKHDEIFPEDLKLDEIEFKHGLSERFNEVSNQKHIRQQSSLIGQMEKYGLLPGSKCITIEFGCGRGEFSRYLNKSVEEISNGETQSRFLLVDRENPRLKFDNKIVTDSKITPAITKRLKIDIKDLKLVESLKEFNEEGLEYIGISKHLCGVATDLTLRCILNGVEDDDNFKFNGFLVAMCCRHCCQYDWLLKESKDYLHTRFGINRGNFRYFRKMFAWATNGVDPKYSKDEIGDHFTNLTFNEREIIGLKMRRILDESRRFALLSKGFKVELVKYCKRDWSLEDNCMIVTPPSSSSL